LESWYLNTCVPPTQLFITRVLNVLKKGSESDLQLEVLKAWYFARLTFLLYSKRSLP
jgi:hypothetical protein